MIGNKQIPNKTKQALDSIQLSRIRSGTIDSEIDQGKRNASPNPKQGSTVKQAVGNSLSRNLTKTNSMLP